MIGRLAVSCALGAAGLSGCMGEGGEPPVAGRIGEPTQLVQCRHWNEAGVRERYGTVEAMRKFAGGPTGSPGGHGRTLDDDDAYELFDRWCSQRHAIGFRLYKLYTRAAAFSSLAE